MTLKEHSQLLVSLNAPVNCKESQPMRACSSSLTQLVTFLDLHLWRRWSNRYPPIVYLAAKLWINNGKTVKCTACAYQMHGMICYPHRLMSLHLNNVPRHALMVQLTGSVLTA